VQTNLLEQEMSWYMCVFIHSNMIVLYACVHSYKHDSPVCVCSYIQT